MADGDVPPKLLVRLRAICAKLPEAYEEQAWVGTRFMIAKRNFAHVLQINAGFPPAYARAAQSQGPLTVLTFRATDLLCDALCAQGPRFFRAIWGTRWQTQVVGLKLTGRIDWPEIEALLRESYLLLAPKKLSARASARGRRGSDRGRTRSRAGRRAGRRSPLGTAR